MFMIRLATDSPPGTIFDHFQDDWTFNAEDRPRSQQFDPHSANTPYDAPFLSHTKYYCAPLAHSSIGRNRPIDENPRKYGIVSYSHHRTGFHSPAKHALEIIRADAGRKA